MKSLIVHYKNKYPDCQVTGDEDKLDVHSVYGAHLVALRKNGAGQVVDMSEEFGCEERHDLEPILKESRVYKLHADGKISKDEVQGSEREAIVKGALEKEESEIFDFNESKGYHKARTEKQGKRVIKVEAPVVKEPEAPAGEGEQVQS